MFMIVNYNMFHFFLRTRKFMFHRQIIIHLPYAYLVVCLWVFQFLQQESHHVLVKMMVVGMAQQIHSQVTVISRRKSKTTSAMLCFSGMIAEFTLEFTKQYHKQRILYEWSFHMKFMKRAFGEFYKFHIK